MVTMVPAEEKKKVNGWYYCECVKAASNASKDNCILQAVSLVGRSQRPHKRAHARQQCISTASQTPHEMVFNLEGCSGTSGRRWCCSAQAVKSCQGRRQKAHPYPYPWCLRHDISK